MIHRIRLNAQHHASFLAEQRKDPITKEPLRAGIDIVICANEKIAFIAENWSGQCPICHGTDTLSYVPTSNLPSRLGEGALGPISRPTPTYQVAQPGPQVALPRRGTVEPMGFWGSIVLSFLLGGGMGLLITNGALDSLVQNVVVISAIYWSAALTVYSLTKQPLAACFSQALLLFISYGLENIIFILVVSAVLYGALTWLTNRNSTSVFALALAALCTEFAFDLYGIIVWQWEFPEFTMINYLFGASLAAVPAFIVGKMLNRY